jgi:squalene-associated FAD-dependent desaturase
MPGTINRVVVIGGGLAGIAAACDLAEAGVPVTLLEARPVLGGKTWSFRDKQTGMTVDNGQHVFLGCCTAYRALLCRLGVTDRTQMQPRMRVPILTAGLAPTSTRAVETAPTGVSPPSPPARTPISPPIGQVLALPTSEETSAWTQSAQADFLARRPVGADLSAGPPGAHVFAGTTLEETRFPLPAPLHLLPSFLRLPMLSWHEKLRAARTLLAIMRAGKRGRARCDGQSFADWLRARGESQRSIKYLWNLITLPTVNEDCERASAGLALMVFQEGLLRRADGARIGYATVGLSELVAEAATRYLCERGAEVRLGCRAASIELADGQISGVRLADSTANLGGLLPACRVIAALPHYLLGRLLPETWRTHPFFARAARLETSPIVGVNLWLDRRVLDEPIVAVIGKQDTYWVFDKGALLGLDLKDGHYLTVSISAAHRYLDAPHQQIITQVRGVLEAVLPALREAQITHALVIKERQATFSAQPGSLANRLPAETPLPGLLLAGAWTNTGWPATMEGAIRSGQHAASLIVRSDTINRSFSGRKGCTSHSLAGTPDTRMQ